MSARPFAFGDRSALRDSGSTAAFTGASRGSSRMTVRFSITPLAFGASSVVSADSKKASTHRVRPGCRLDDVRRPPLALVLVEVASGRRRSASSAS